jgi:hypothetical protein
MSPRPRSYFNRLLDSLGLPTLLGIPVGLILWYFFAPEARSGLHAILAAVGGALLGTGYFVLEGARDLTDEIHEEEGQHLPILSLRIRPLAILTFFLVIAIGLFLIGLAIYFGRAAT